MSTDTLIRPQVGDPALSQGEGRKAHIIRKDQATDAYVYGSPVEALCGYVWVPSRDPKQFPLCAACKEIADEAFRDEGGADAIE